MKNIHVILFCLLLPCAVAAYSPDKSLSDSLSGEQHSNIVNQPRETCIEMAENDVHVPNGGISILIPEASAEKALVKVKVTMVNDDKESNEATIKVELLQSDQFIASKYINTYLTAEGKTTSNFSFEIENPKLWTSEKPYQYEARVTVTPLIGSPVFDVAKKTFCIRK